MTQYRSFLAPVEKLIYRGLNTNRSNFLPLPFILIEKPKAESPQNSGESHDLSKSDKSNESHNSHYLSKPVQKPSSNSNKEKPNDEYKKRDSSKCVIIKAGLNPTKEIRVEIYNVIDSVSKYDPFVFANIFLQSTSRDRFDLLEYLGDSLLELFGCLLVFMNYYRIDDIKYLFESQFKSNLIEESQVGSYTAERYKNSLKSIQDDILFSTVFFRDFLPKKIYLVKNDTLFDFMRRSGMDKVIKTFNYIDKNGEKKFSYKDYTKYVNDKSQKDNDKIKLSLLDDKLSGSKKCEYIADRDKYIADVYESFIGKVAFESYKEEKLFVSNIDKLFQIHGKIVDKKFIQYERLNVQYITTFDNIIKDLKCRQFTQIEDIYYTNPFLIDEYYRGINLLNECKVKMSDRSCLKELDDEATINYARKIQLCDQLGNDLLQFCINFVLIKTENKNKFKTSKTPPSIAQKKFNNTIENSYTKYSKLYGFLLWHLMLYFNNGGKEYKLGESILIVIKMMLNESSVLFGTDTSILSCANFIKKDYVVNSEYKAKLKEIYSKHIEFKFGK